jgi:O-antigen ligase/Flp pilus assembly protein TadD
MSGNDSPADPATDERRRVVLPRRRPVAVYEWTALALTFVSFAAGAVAFGAVRMWSIGPLSTLVFLGGVLVFLRAPVFRAGAPWSIPPGAAWMIPFLAYALFTISRAAVPYEAGLQMLMIATAPVAYLVYANLAGRHGRWKILAGLLIFGVIAIGSYAILQHVRGMTTVAFGVQNPYVTRQGSDLVVAEMRRGGPYVCPNHFASVMAMGAVFALALIFTPEIGVGFKIVCGYSVGVAVYGIYLSQSRSGMLGLAAGIIVLVVLTAWRHGRRIWAMALAVLGPLSAGGVGWALFMYSPLWRKRIVQALSGQEARPKLWRDAYDMICEAPWLGWGGGSYRWIEHRFHLFLSPGQWAQYAHNEYVHLPVEYGLIGFILLAIPALVATGAFLRRVHTARRPRDGMLAAAALAVGAAVAVHAVFDFNWHIYSVGHFAIAVFGICAAALHADGEFRNRLPGMKAGRIVAWTGAAVCAVMAVLIARASVAHVILRSADAAADLHHYDRAEQLYRRAGAWDGRHWHPPAGLARVAKNRAAFAPDATDEQRARWLAEAEALYLKADRRNPWEPAIPHGLSEIYQQTDRPEEALACFDRLVRNQPRRTFFHVRHGVQLRRMGRLDEAEAALKKALALERRNPEARLYLRAIEQERARAKTVDDSTAP